MDEDRRPTLDEWVEEQKPRMIEACRSRGFVRAHLHLFASNEGGRRGRLGTGYRASWSFGEVGPRSETVIHDAPLLIEGRDSMAPGEEADVRLVVLFPDLWPPLRAGEAFELWEGRVIGRAEYIETVGPEGGT